MDGPGSSTYPTRIRTPDSLRSVQAAARGEPSLMSNPTAGPGPIEMQNTDIRTRVLRLVDSDRGSSSNQDTAERNELLLGLLGPSACRQLGIFRLPEGFVLSVVIPVYNEVKTIAEVVRKVRECGVPTQIILVDDGSTDGTRPILDSWRNEPDLKIIFHERNQGKGAGLITGFQHATGDVVIVQDADLEYDPAEFPKLIQPIVEDQADVVFGSRFKGDNQRVLYFWHSIGNYVLTLLSNMMTNLCLLYTSDAADE